MTDTHRRFINRRTIRERSRRIRLVILDFDGVLTDGRIVYGENGHEMRSFDVTDGLGIVLLKRAGIPVVIMSSRKSTVLARRARELKVEKYYQNVPDKLELMERLLKRFRMKHEEVCFLGDDLGDISVLRRVGLAVAVPHAVREVKAQADVVTQRAGGRGAVREIAEYILKVQGKWSGVLAGYQ